MSSPKVSVITSVWNQGELLKETIQSIENQTLDDWEYIIVADKSPDNTIRVARDAADQDDRITFILNDNREYYTRSLNIGIEAADGDFIAINDGDDLSSPARLETQVDYMEVNPDTILTLQHAFYARVVDSDGDIIPNNEYFYPENYDYPAESGLFSMALTRIHSSHMYRNEGIRYREKFQHSQDVDMFCRCIGSDWDVKILKDDLATRRIHNNQKQSRDLSAGADDINAEEGFQEMAIRDFHRALRGWDLKYDNWNPDLPYKPEDHSPHTIMYESA